MQIDNKLFDDLARMAAGAAGTAIGVRDEIEAQVRQQAERLLSRMDLVTRDEFEAVREMASQARAEQEAMAERLAALEQRLAEAEGATAPAGAEGAPRNPPEGA
jgi:BMFP domain-containing protein YqiC